LTRCPFVGESGRSGRAEREEEAAQQQRLTARVQPENRTESSGRHSPKAHPSAVMTIWRFAVQSGGFLYISKRYNKRFIFYIFLIQDF